MERDTRQKKIIYEVLRDCHLHPTLQELSNLVKERDNNIGQATVYRTINRLVASGKVEKIVSINSNARYDVANDHYHFQCIKCGKIEDIFYDKGEQESIKKMFSNKKVNTFDLTGYGICSICLEDNH